MQIVVLGKGEIGSSVGELYEEYHHNVFYIDKQTPLDSVKAFALDNNTDVLNVAIPFQLEDENFEDVVYKYIKILRPVMCIIHSTIDVGTTRNIKYALDDDEEAFDTILVHSPVEGIHPYLKKSMQIFSKFVGGFSVEESTKVAEHLYELGIYTTICDSPEESELAKMLSTTYYGLNIRFMQAVKEQCDALDLDFDTVYKKFNENYNASYTDMGMPHVNRPVLKFMGYGISGHCISQNAELLHRQFGDNISRFVLEAGYNPENTEAPLYQNRTWLYAEYYGKDKSFAKIAEECGVSDVTIQNWAKRFNIPTKTRNWTEEEDDLLKELSKEMTFKEISDSGLLERTYEQIRNRAYRQLNLKSVYDPSTPSEETRIKISTTLRGLKPADFDGFMWESLQRVHRKDYMEWRKNVLSKYDYTCQKTKTRGGKLNVHHISPWSTHPDKRFDVDNGIVLSEKAHIQFHRKYGYTDCTVENLREFLSEELVE